MKLTKTKMDKLRKYTGLSKNTNDEVVKDTLCKMIANNKLKII